MSSETERQIKKLQDTLGKMEVALGSITEAIVWTSREGKIQWCNRSFDQLIGQPHLRLLGADLFELFPLKQAGELLPFERHPLPKALEEGEQAGIYEFGERQTRILEVTARLVPLTDQELSAILLIRDITHQKQAEEAEKFRIAKERAEEASQAKTQFLTRMSHELRTPLNSVIGFTNVLLKRSHLLGQKERMYLERILVNSKHLLDLINGVLDISRVEAGRMDLDIDEVRLDQLVEETVADIQAQCPPDVRLVAQIPERVVPLKTDPLKLKQILMNLLSNALKFTEKGSVTVQLQVDERTRKPIRIDVADTGKGIPDYRLRRIFEPFEGKDTRLPTEEQGTGLGLTIVRSLCELLDYRIEVESEVGRGTTFSIFLESVAKGMNSAGNRSH